MNGALHPDPGPGLVARDLPRAAVIVRDPEGKHRFFKEERRGTHFGANMRGDVAWTICVTIGGQDYVVPPHFVLSDVSGLPIEHEPTGAVIIPFPPGGWRGGTR